DATKFPYLLVPVGGRPVGAVEMAAAMAGNLVSLQMRLPDIAKTRDDFITAEREADIGRTRPLVRRLVIAPVLSGHQEDAGQEIGEVGVVLLRQFARAGPQCIVMGTVEGDQHILRLCG